MGRSEVLNLQNLGTPGCDRRRRNVEGVVNLVNSPSDERLLVAIWVG